MYSLQLRSKQQSIIWKNIFKDFSNCTLVFFKHFWWAVALLLFYFLKMK